MKQFLIDRKVTYFSGTQTEILANYRNDMKTDSPLQLDRSTEELKKRLKAYRNNELICIKISF